jgi:peptide/nickel transport system substrate-binding protein
MRKRLFGFAMSAAIIAAACGSSATPGTSKAPTSGPSGAPTTAATQVPLPDLTKTNYKPEPVSKRGGKLVLGISGEPTTIWWNIYDSFANNVDVFSPALWSLWGTTADLKFYPQLTTRVPTTINKDVTITGTKMDVKIELIPGSQWSDGKPITCADVEAMWKFMTDKAQTGTIQGTVGWEDITSIDGGTGTSCVAHFGKVYENFLALWSPLLPAHYLATTTVTDAVNKLYTQADPGSGVYSGPYIPTAWAAGAQTDLKPNPKFWDTIKKAQAPFDSVTFRYYSDTAAEIAGFSKGEIDTALEFNHTHLAAIKAANIPDAQVDITDGVTYEQHSWNMASLTKKFGADGAKALMEAVKYIYDKAAINQRILGNSATPSCSFTTPQTWFYSDIPCYKTDTAKANDILTKAGFTKGSDGTLVAKNGTKVELLGCTRSDRAYRVDTMVLVANQLAAQGIKTNNQAVNSSILFKGWTLADSDVPCNLTHGNYDYAEFAWLSTPDPLGIYQLYHSKYDPSLGDHSGQNYIRFNNPEADKLLDEANTTVDLVKIRDNFKRLQEIYVDPANAFPEVALYNWRTVLLKIPALKNVVNNGSSATQTWNLEDWWRQ